MERVLEKAAQESSQNQYASFGRRLGACLLDGIVLFVFSFVISLVFIGGVSVWAIASQFDKQTIQVLIQVVSNILSIFLGWLYYSIFESSEMQATPGKWILGLKLSAKTGERITFARATGRYFSKMLYCSLLFITGVAFIAVLLLQQQSLLPIAAVVLFVALILSGIFSIVGHAMIFMTAKKQTFHDWLSGVVVVKKNAMGQIARLDEVPDDKHSNLFS